MRGRLNAWFFDAFDAYINRRLAERKRKLFRELPDNIVEIGAGVGANFAYYPAGANVTAVEPNVHMHKSLRRRANEFGVRLDLMESGAESMPLWDECADAVVATLVLCTVEDPERVIGEVRRVLKPGGRFLFLEHVVAPHGHWRHRLQRVVHRPWRYAFEGCNTNRDTASHLKNAGFRELAIERYVMAGPFLPVNSQIAGVAVK